MKNFFLRVRRAYGNVFAPLIEGIFDSAFSWLAIARSFPKTNRGSELSSMLSLYVLQYRIDVDVEDNVSPEPNSLPLSHTFVMDIIINNVDGMISHAKNNPTDYNLMSAKVSFMDIAMQAVSIELDGDTVDLVMGKLNKLTEMTRSTMVAKWHEVRMNYRSVGLTLMHMLIFLSLGENHRVSHATKIWQTHEETKTV